MVSVIIPTFNRAKTIKQAAESVLNQTYRDIELIIVDDGSSDNTIEVINELKREDERVVYIQHEKNLGACAARNTGILKAKGDYIAFQDSDDVWMKDKLEKQMIVMEHEDVDICFCQIEINQHGKKQYMPTVFKPGIQYNINTVFSISMQTLVIKKNVVLNNMLDVKMPRLQDFDLMVRIARDNKIYYLAIPLVHVELSCDSITKQNDKLNEACKLLRVKYPKLKEEYPRSCFQISKALIKSSCDEKGKLKYEMLREALIFDKSISTLLRVLYYHVFRKIYQKIVNVKKNMMKKHV